MVMMAMMVAIVVRMIVMVMVLIMVITPLEAVNQVGYLHQCQHGSFHRLRAFS